MAVGNIIMALDVLNGLVQASARITAAVQAANLEGRDLTDIEMQAIQAKSIQLEDDWLAGEPQSS